MVTKLTSVKVLHNLYNKFKMLSIEDGFSLQKLVNRSVYLYLTDDKFRNEINKTEDLEVSGSNF